MKKLLIIKDLEQLKSISDPFRMKLLGMLAKEAKTGQMLADELDIPRAKVHYHINQLVKNNIITVSHTLEKKSILQKFYQPVAEFIVPDLSILNYRNEEDDFAPHVFKRKTSPYQINALLKDIETLSAEKPLVSNDEHSEFLINVIELNNKMNEEGD